MRIFDLLLVKVIEEGAKEVLEHLYGMGKDIDIFQKCESFYIVCIFLYAK